MSLDANLEIKVDTGNEPFIANLHELNITHNLGEMASACGLYEAMWRPFKILGYTEEEEDDVCILAVNIIQALKNGIRELESDPVKYKVFNPPNGWGDYDGLLKVATLYLDACQKYPKAEVKVWR